MADTPLKDIGVSVAAGDVINDILAFCAQGVEGRDMLAQADYAADAQRPIGHQPGIARQMFANKQARQAAHMAAGLAQFLARRYAPGVRDDADLDKVEAALVQAVNVLIDAKAARYLVCSTAAATAAKEVAAAGFSLAAGASLQLLFVNVNTAIAPTLNVGGTGAKPLYYCGSPVEVGALAAGQVYELIYAGDKWQITGGMSPFRVCEVYNFLQPVQRPGFVQAAGGLIANAAALYPQAFAFLQTSDGQALCVTEAEWQAMSTAIYYTNADGVSEGWNGVGGVPKFVIDTANGSIRVPDLRGMYMEAAGLDSLAVGGVHHDRVRNVVGQTDAFWIHPQYVSNGPFTYGELSVINTGASTGVAHFRPDLFDVSRVVPTGSHNVPRAFGVLTCIYLGA